MNNSITEAHIKAAMTYEEYRSLIDQLLIAGKTTGENQSPGMIEYTRLNVQRMNRMEKKFEVNEELAHNIKKIPKWYWVVLTEAWCGDAAHIIPSLNKIAESNPNLQLKLLLRDEYNDIKNNYLTVAHRSIPILICLKKNTLEELGTWGPRPVPAQQIVTDFKSNPYDTAEEFVQKIHAWYNQDKGKTLQMEINQCIDEWKTK